MNKIHIICDKNKRSLKIKNSIFKLLKKNEIKRQTIHKELNGNYRKKRIIGVGSTSPLLINLTLRNRIKNVMSLEMIDDILSIISPFITSNFSLRNLEIDSINLSIFIIIHTKLNCFFYYNLLKN